MSGRAAEADIVVVGAGFAGLAAATELHAAGADFLLLEARDRIGGRVEASTNGLDEKVDLGGQFICDDMPEIMALAKAHRAALVETPVRGQAVVQPQPQDAGQLYPRVSAIRDRMNEVDLDAPALADLSVAAWLDHQPDDAAAKSGFLSMIEGLWCQPPEAVPLWYLVENDRRITNEVPELQYFLAGTMHALAGEMARPLAGSIRLSEPVSRIVHDDHGVTVHTARASVTARQVIIAAPPVMAGRISFDPPLAAGLAKALASWRSGCVIKAFVRYAKPFWRETGLSGTVFYLEPHGLYACDASADDDHAALVVFVGGGLATKWRALGDAGMRSQILERLSPALGPLAAHPLDVTLRDWSEDAWSGGAYSDIVADFTARDAEAALREGAESIRFASSELSPSFPGYIEGALVAGRLGARQALMRLKAMRGG